MISNEYYCAEIQLYGQFAAIRARRYLEMGAIRLAIRAQGEAAAHYQDAWRALAALIGAPAK